MSRAPRSVRVSAPTMLPWTPRRERSMRTRPGATERPRPSALSTASTRVQWRSDVRCPGETTPRRSRFRALPVRSASIPTARTRQASATATTTRLAAYEMLACTGAPATRGRPWSVEPQRSHRRLTVAEAPADAFAMRATSASATSRRWRPEATGSQATRTPASSVLSGCVLTPSGCASRWRRCPNRGSWPTGARPRTRRNPASRRCRGTTREACPSPERSRS